MGRIVRGFLMTIGVLAILAVLFVPVWRGYQTERKGGFDFQSEVAREIARLKTDIEKKNLCPCPEPVKSKPVATKPKPKPAPVVKKEEPKTVYVPVPQAPPPPVVVEVPAPPPPPPTVVYLQPAPVVQPTPVYVEQPPVYVQPPPVYAGYPVQQAVVAPGPGYNTGDLFLAGTVGFVAGLLSDDRRVDYGPRGYGGRGVHGGHPGGGSANVSITNVNTNTNTLRGGNANAVAYGGDARSNAHSAITPPAPPAQRPPRYGMPPGRSGPPQYGRQPLTVGTFPGQGVGRDGLLHPQGGYSRATIMPPRQFQGPGGGMRGGGGPRRR